MKRILVALLLLIGSISGCSIFDKENKKESEEKIVKDKSEKVTKNQKEKNDKVENPVTDQDSLKNYRPKVGVKKIFVDHENIQSLTEEVIYESGDFVQFIVKIGQSASVVVYKWTDNEISIVKTIKNPNDPYKNYLENLSVDNNPEIMISKDESIESDWIVISQNETVQTSNQSFKDVYVIQKITNEVEGAETIYTNYLAPGIGLVKESFEVTGEQGYSAESTLQKIEE